MKAGDKRQMSNTVLSYCGKPVTIRGEMAALELSYDRDWIRYKASLFWASGR